MRQILLAVVALWLCLIVLPVAMAYTGQEMGTAHEQWTETQGGLNQDSEDGKTLVQVYDKQQGKVVEMTLQDYLVGVVAAEMPASFEEEALKAQAVAARSYTVSRMKENSQNENLYEQHQGADVCTDYHHCKAFLTPAERRQRYGANYEQYEQKVEQAVAQTDGQIAVYDQEPIVAVFHSTSSGHTESAQDVWGNDVPYLQSVESPGEEASPRYESEVTVTKEEFVSQLAAASPGIAIEGELEQCVGEMVRSDAGGVESVELCGVSFTGAQVREMFGLRSTHFTIETTPQQMTFHVLGYGHGVGLSQYGANYMAQQGSTWQEIITWYYTGVNIVGMSDVAL